MRTRATILFLAMMLSTAVAFARAERLIAAPPNPAEDPRVIARAVVDPEFFELALQDRELVPFPVANFRAKRRQMLSMHALTARRSA